MFRAKKQPHDPDAVIKADKLIQHLSPPLLPHPLLSVTNTSAASLRRRRSLTHSLSEGDAEEAIGCGRR